ncbi:MAG: hypothetical protein ACE5EF_03305 [Dehalococcoidia bacterium]
MNARRLAAAPRRPSAFIAGLIRGALEDERRRDDIEAALAPFEAGEPRG